MTKSRRFAVIVVASMLGLGVTTVATPAHASDSSWGRGHVATR